MSIIRTKDITASILLMLFNFIYALCLRDHYPATGFIRRWVCLLPMLRFRSSSISCQH